ncbi:MAG TPA: thioredoxin family protein [Gammaproteobacteria bacterium]|nr:thioredoxin family protein [Gammaproteobacteria bacterium]
MSKTPSTMLELGSQAIDFSLPDPSTNTSVSLTDFAGQPVLVAFICNHCPYVIHIMDEFSAFAKEYGEKGLKIIAINANDVENYADDSPEKMVEFVKQYNLNFPYLFDETQETAKAYTAACTPDFFMYDTAGKLVYRGQFDAARPKSDTPVNGADMRAAADALLAGNAPDSDQIPSLGCNIKWKAGNEPEYFG